ncbi:DUF7551 domain-containing protein [Haloplanus rubicundus]|uniref:Uncharacterized protein n=1 Tax=Haloplanus rubicundus TaxID=1547898 RepID=A0A345EF96_9EURY|nr:hypothetical protein [Haloplanus rubicundus]AXG10868.1 hypothetical protein DU484_14000 [Haloplanus rubicundus]
MIGDTLAELRTRIDALTSDDGAYYLVCGRTGDRPVPAAGARFPDRESARTAARTVEQYRAYLRRYDPRYPHFDVIVCQDDRATEDSAADPDPDTWTLSTPVLDGAAAQPSNRDLVEFCHRVAAAVFETLSDAGHDATERAITSDYDAVADALADPDGLCLYLLERMATTLDRRLTPTAQARVLTDAATRLAPVDPVEDPLSDTLGSLQRRGLLGAYRQSPWAADLDAGTRSVDVHLSEYALFPRRGRLPVLPLVVGLYRRHPDRPPSSLRAVDDGDGWRLTLALDADAEPNGLISAPIRSDA